MTYVHCGLFMRLHFTIGCYDRRWTSRRRQSFQFSRIQVLFADHVHRRSGVDNKFSVPQVLRFDGTGKHLFPYGEKNVVVYFSFNFWIFHAFRLFLRATLTFYGLVLRWWGSPGQITPSDVFWYRILAWRNTASVNWTPRIGFSMFELFRKIDEDFGGSISWNTQPTCRVLFLHRHCTFVTILLTPFARRFVNLAMRIRALFPKSASTLGLVGQALRRMPFFTEWSGASSFEVILAGRSKHSTTGTLASGSSGSRCISHILPHERIRRRMRLCRFCTLIDIVAETGIVSSRTPIANNLQEFSRTRCFVPWFLTTAFLS